MRLAILGTRGIPANYGGFETFAEELGARLADRGHEVTVYCRDHYVPRGSRQHRGVHLVVLPTVRHKYLDTLVHTFLSMCHALTKGYASVVVCNAANALFCAPLRAVGVRVLLNVDGIERKRRKWNALGRGWYRLSERLATWCPTEVVTDAEVIREYYDVRYGCPSTFIPYGCRVGRDAGRATLDRFGLEPDRYLLYVSRLEPENNAHVVIRAYEDSGVTLPLVVVGDAPYAREYIESLKRLAGPRVLFTGAVYGDGYRELQCHALAYVQATEVGGTHPALIEAMGFGNCILVNDVPEHREVVGTAGLYFSAAEPASLAVRFREVTADASTVTDLRLRATARARERYSWDAVTDSYEALLGGCTRRRAA